LITNTIARRYAKALVQLGTEESAVDAFNAELAALCATLRDNPELEAILGNPAYGIEAKKEILKDVVAAMSLSVTVGNFVQLLLDRNRLQFLPQIAESYGSFADELSGIIRPTLTSGLPLADSQVEAIKGALATKTGKKVQLTVQVDPALIGGVVTQIGGMIYDGSVKTQLNRIEDILQKG
jgi:F-type H+-transporting ATPase subunit delta